MLAAPGNLLQMPTFWNYSDCKTTFSAASVNFQNVRWAASYTWCICDYITNLCREQAETRQNHENGNTRHIGKCEAQHRSLAAGKPAAVQVTNLRYYVNWMNYG
jgi:hypothetical protein